MTIKGVTEEERQLLRPKESTHGQVWNLAIEMSSGADRAVALVEAENHAVLCEIRELLKLQILLSLTDNHKLRDEIRNEANV